MALKTVTGKITRPDGVVGAVSLRIVLSAPAVIAGTQEVVPAAIDVTVAPDGTWSQPLQANLDLLPPTTWYTGFETIGGVTAPFIFVVPQSAGPFKLADILSVASAPLPSPPAALDSLVVHLAGPETITGDKTFAGSMIEGKDFHRSAQTVTEAVLVSGVDATAGELVDVTLTANRVVGLPLNPAVGQELVLLVTMGGTGGYKLTYPAGIKTAWQPASAVGDVSALRLRYFGTNWQQIGGQVAVSQLGVLAHRGPAVVGSLTVRDPSSSGPNTPTALPGGSVGQSFASSIHPAFDPVAAGADPTGAVDSTALLSQVGTAAAAANGVLLIAGTFLAALTSPNVITVPAGKTLVVRGDAGIINVPVVPGADGRRLFDVQDGGTLILDGTLALQGPPNSFASYPAINSWGVYATGAAVVVAGPNVTINGFATGITGAWRTGDNFNPARDMTAPVIWLLGADVSGNGGIGVLVEGTGEFHSYAGTYIRAWGLAGSNQYHGVYLHSGVTCDIDDIRFGSTPGIGWALHTFHSTGNPRYWRAANVVIEAGAYHGIITPYFQNGLRAQIGRVEFQGRGDAGLWVNGDTDVRDLVIDPPATTPAGAQLIRSYTSFFFAATNGSPILTLSGHGLGNDDQVIIDAGTSATGFTLYAQVYFVVNATATTIQLSLTKGGVAINATSNGTVQTVHQTDCSIERVRVAPGTAGLFPFFGNSSGATWHVRRGDFPTVTVAQVVSIDVSTRRPTFDFRDVRASDSAGAAFSGAAQIFGDGNDGAAVFDGTNTFAFASKAGSVYTLTRNVYLTTCQILVGVTLKTNDYSIFCSVLFQNAGTVDNSGNAAVGAVGGTNNGSGNWFGRGNSGGAGGVNAGTGAVAAATWASLGSGGGTGGAGGTGAAGAGGTISRALGGIQHTIQTYLLNLSIASASGNFVRVSGGNGGGGGGGDGVNSGGGGGGGAGVVAIFAAFFVNWGTISAIGGAGANGVAGNAGGGGGGGGGACVVVYRAWTGLGTQTFTGGTPGNGTGTGVVGSFGVSGISLAIAA